MRKFGIPLLVLFCLLPIIKGNSYAEEKQKNYNLVYEMKVVKFWNVEVNWRNQKAYPVVDRKSVALHKKVTQELTKIAKKNSSYQEKFVIK